jgi:hypothetical protein
VTLRHLHVGAQQFDLRLWRHGKATKVEVLSWDAAAVVIAGIVTG